jgi:putative endonuclease
VRRRPGWNTTFGEAAERFAARLLEGEGLVVEARRYRVHGGEIDLVARDGIVLVFVEVKARRSNAFGVAAESVGRRKQRRLLTAARRYLAETGFRGACRFDVIAVESADGRLRARWIRHAFSV